jgi:hypothetical protein
MCDCKNVPCSTIKNVHHIPRLSRNSPLPMTKAAVPIDGLNPLIENPDNSAAWQLAGFLRLRPVQGQDFVNLGMDLRDNGWPCSRPAGRLGQGFLRHPPKRRTDTDVGQYRLA